MIIPNNRFSRIFIKKRYLPLKIRAGPLITALLLLSLLFLLTWWDESPVLKASVVFWTVIGFSVFFFVGVVSTRHGKHLKKLPRGINGAIRLFVRGVLLSLHYIGVGVMWFLYYVGSIVKGLYNGMLYSLHYIGVGVIYFFYYAGMSVRWLSRTVLYSLHYIGVGVIYFFYYAGVGVGKVFHAMVKASIFLKSLGVIILFYSKKGAVESARKTVRGAKLVWSYANWIMILLAALVAFQIAPINVVEKVFYIVVFLMLIVLTYLLREELGFIGKGLQAFTSFVNTKQGFFFILPLFIFIVSEMLLVNSVENTINFYAFAIIFFIILSALSGERLYRNYWGVLTIPVILRIVNLGLPFPIINAKLQLMITYSVLTYCSLLFIKYMDIKVDFFKPDTRILDYVIAVIIGLSLGTVEFVILGHVPIIQTISTMDVVYLVFTILIIGFGEELIYRGLLQTIQTELFGVKGALFLTSVLFGIMHLIWRNPLEFFFTTFAGFLFGLQFHKTKSILPPTVAHIVNNTAWLIIMPWVVL